MMKRNSRISFADIVRLMAILVLAGALPAQTIAQTPGGTSISNQASATYSDGSGGSYSTVSNTVVVIVSNVSGLAITPDAGSNPTVVAGQTGVLYSFTVTNTGNFSDQVRFLASGASVTLAGPGAVTQAVIDVDNSNSINAGDTDIFTNGADVLSANIAQSGFIRVLVEVSVNAGASVGQSVQVLLGDSVTGPTFDNEAADTSANEVRTVSATSVNGLREARGDISATVVNDGMLQLSLTAPAGPVPLGSDLTYVWQLCNVGSTNVNSITLANAPGGSDAGIFIMAPIPAGTVLKSGQVFPAGTLYTTSSLATSPLTATWTTTEPVPLSSLTRIAFNVGPTLASGGTCSANFNMLVTITTTDATNPILEIGDAFGNSILGALLSEQSGDAVANAGDGNANFDEGAQPGNVDGNGIIQQTPLLTAGSVLIGPTGQPAAVGPTDNNDDYTNRSVNVGIAGVPPGGTTTAANTLTFPNTVQNTGNANDTFTLSAPTFPAGFTVEISIDNGVGYTTVQPGNGSVSLAVAFGASADILVRVTAPSGLTILSPFEVVIRAASTITPANTNNTIDRVYTGFLRLDKAVTVNNTTGTGGPTDAVPGAEIIYTVTYTNVSSSGGVGNVGLTATNIVITENGGAAPNNWGATTNHVVGASDTNGGTITGDVAGSTLLTDTIASLGPGQSGVFTFKRQIP